MNDDSYITGQYVGILFLIALIERDNGVDKEFLNRLKIKCADGSAKYLKKPSEDVLLMVDKMARDI